jgi:hypothetical protein
MSLEFSSSIRQEKESAMKKRGRANFNDLTNYREKSKFIDQIFCKCGMPVSPYDEKCGKCDREFSWKDMAKAVDTQNALRKENEKKQKYTPPAIFL